MRLLLRVLRTRIDAVIAACLRKRPDPRYPSMRALLADLERLLAGEAPAPPAPKHQPDEYEPKNPMSRTAARSFRSPAG